MGRQSIPAAEGGGVGWMDGAGRSELHRAGMVAIITGDSTTAHDNELRDVLEQLNLVALYRAIRLRFGTHLLFCRTKLCPFFLSEFSALPCIFPLIRVFWTEIGLLRRWRLSERHSEREGEKERRR